MKFEDYQEVNEKAFNILGGSYREKRESSRQDFEKTTETFIEYLLTNFSVPRVLEIGSGAGIALNIFEKRGFKTTAIDISLEMINLARESSPLTEFIKGNFLLYDFNGKIFQGVFARSVFHLFPTNKSREFLEKIHAILDKDGILYLSVPLYDELNEGHVARHFGSKSFDEFRVRYNRDELMRCINNSNLYNVNKKDVSPFKDTEGNLVSRLELLLKKRT